jgi:hypothetical protein
MKSITILSILLFFIPQVFGADEEYRASVVEYNAILPRCPLDTNTPAIIYGEIRDPDRLMKILGPVKPLVPALSLRALLGGNNDKFTLSISFLEGHESKKAIADTIRQYVEYRWRGFSGEGAVALLGAERKPESGPPAQVAALKTAAPWLKYEALQPFKAPHCVSVWWLREEIDFVVRDRDVTYWISFLGPEKNFALVRALDSKEFHPENQKLFAEAAAVAKTRVELGEDKNPKSPIAYWREMQSVLKEKKVRWFTPEELNPMDEWR